MIQYLKGGYKEDGGFLFIRTKVEKTCGSEYKMYQMRLCLGVRSPPPPIRTDDHWNKLPRDVIETPSLEVLKMRVERLLD